jgi:alkylation response protein AidB-like acyl-CoA dehydrogenase
MPLVLNEEQRLLKDTARDFLGEQAPVEALRKLRDEHDPLGYSADLWSQMAQLGWAGIVLPEEYGGLDFGFVGLGGILEECGRNLTASPLLASVVLGASAILLAGTDAQKAANLPRVASGQLTLALALEEGNHHHPYNCALTAERNEQGWLLNGHKTFVLDGHSADQLIVVARTASEPGDKSGITLFLVDANSKGITRQRTLLIDSRNTANISFDNVQLDGDAILGQADQGADVLDAVLNRGRIAVATEMLGGCIEVLERTLCHLKEREQFGVKIGSFQALKHRAADMFSNIELSKSVVFDALLAIDEDREDLARVASCAKAKLNETFHLVTNEGVQMHGGIGVTDELEIGFFLKRSRVLEQVFGNTGFHRDRYATLSGF